MTAPAAHELKALCLRTAPPLRVAAAESLTGGRIQSLITSVSGSSGYFLGGVTAYSLAQKAALLGVKRAPAARVNAVSPEVAAQMARGAARLFGADIAVSTTGYAEPSPAHGVAEPFAYWAIARRAGSRVRIAATGRINCRSRDRVQAQDHVAEAVLAELVAFLRASPPGDRRPPDAVPAA